MDNVTLLSTVVFLPALGALALTFFPKENPQLMKRAALLVTVLVFALTAWMAVPDGEKQGGRFGFGDNGKAIAEMQNTFNVEWIPSFNIEYYMGLDGISFPLILLTSFISMLSMWASWPINKHVKAYCILFLLLETGMLGVFMALDFFLFYVFWEVMLLPMYFLIGVWGGPRREYAAIKFFLFTLFGSVLMLIAILMLYFSSDLKGLSVEQLKTAHAVPHDASEEQLQARLSDLGFSSAENKIAVSFPSLTVDAAKDLAKEIKKLPYSLEEIILAVQDPNRANDKFIKQWREQHKLDDAKYDDEIILAAQIRTLADNDLAQALEETDPSSRPSHTFNILALQQIGQHTAQFNTEVFGARVQIWAFVLLLIGFIIKVPSVPFHTWLPDAHVEAPTPISMILAGVLLKMGGYGIIRICYPICPEAGVDLAYWVCGLGVVSMVYGAFAAMAQKDFKRLVAYSSVSHMGYVLLGLGVWSATQDNNYNSDYWAMGMNGAMFQMIGHGISSAGMFFLVGVIYDRVHHRNIDEFGGLFDKMPIYSGLAIGIFFAGLGLPGLCGFIGEFWVTLSVWKFSPVLAVISASVVILTAGYILWTIQRVYLGSEYKGPNADKIRPADAREITIAGTLLAFAILFGVFPQLVFNYMEPTITKQAEVLTEWRVTYDAKQNAIESAGSAGLDEAANPQADAIGRNSRPADEQAPDGVPQRPTPEVVVNAAALKTESDLP